MPAHPGAPGRRRPRRVRGSQRRRPARPPCGEPVRQVWRHLVAGKNRLRVDLLLLGLRCQAVLDLLLAVDGPVLLCLVELSLLGGLLWGAERFGLLKAAEQHHPGDDQGAEHGDGREPAGEQALQLDLGQAHHRAAPTASRPSSAVSSRNTDSRSARTGVSSFTKRLCAARRLVISAPSLIPSTTSSPPSRRTRRPPSVRMRCAATGSATPTRTDVAVWSPITSATRPDASSRPWPMIETVSATCSTSSRMWLLTRTVLPCSPSDRIVLRISRMPAGSRPLVGSSKISRSGSLSSVAAMASRCFMPRE